MRSSSRCARCFRACSLDSPYCGVVGPRGDLHPWRAVYMSVLSVDDVPLYHLCPGGVALRVVVPGALYSCSSCWWRDYADPRAVVLRELSPDAVVSKARLAAADLVLIDGCEPAVHDWVLQLARSVRERGLRVAIRASGLAAPERYRELGALVDAFVVEHPVPVSPEPRLAAAFARGLAAMLSTGRLVELLVPYDGSRRAEAIASELAARYRDRVVIHVVPSSDEAAARAYKLVKELREDDPFTYLYGDTSYTLTSTACPYCGTPVVSRHAYGVRVRAREAEGGARCPSCGRTLPLVLCGARRPRALHRELVVW